MKTTGTHASTLWQHLRTCDGAIFPAAELPLPPAGAIGAAAALAAASPLAAAAMPHSGPRPFLALR